jgi:guanylate kinase
MSVAGKLVLIIGPSGVGKSAILHALRARHSEWIFPRSATTRKRREGEGTDLYHFVSEEDFSMWLSEKKFLEWAQVHKGARYGTLLSEIIPPILEGNIVVREVDVQGFESIRTHPLFQKDQYPLFTIFILPESEKQLIDQIEKRAPMEKEELQRRLESMRKELSVSSTTDKQIENIHGQLDQTVTAVEEAILG